MATRLLLVDDQTLFRAGLGLVIESHNAEFKVVGQESAAAAALERVRQIKPDLMITALYLSDLNGIELARRALEILPKLKIIILAERISLSEIQEALSSGVLVFLFKQTIPEHFIEAIDLVGKGQRYLAREATSLVLEDYKRLLETANAPGKSPLSLREQEVWRLISEGKRNKDIAGLMDVGETTVETYRRRLMTKLGCGSTADLIRKALLNRIGRP